MQRAFTLDDASTLTFGIEPGVGVAPQFRAIVGKGLAPASFTIDVAPEVEWLAVSPKSGTVGGYGAGFSTG